MTPTNTLEPKALEARIDEILDEDAPDKWVWKSHGSMETWARETLLPVLRDVRAYLSEEFQPRVAPWMQVCFGPEISNDKLERGDRHLEEVLEMLQSGDYPQERVAALTQYVYDRPKGEPHQEVGGVMVTLAAYCLAHGLDMHQAAEDELARIWTKVDKIRAKQATKPVGSALPIATAALAAKGLLAERLETTANAVDLLDSGSRYTMSMRRETKAILLEAAAALAVPAPEAPTMPSRERMRDKIESDRDLETEARPEEPRAHAVQRKRPAATIGKSLAGDAESLPSQQERSSGSAKDTSNE